MHTICVVVSAPQSTNLHELEELLAEVRHQTLRPFEVTVVGCLSREQEMARVTIGAGVRLAILPDEDFTDAAALTLGLAAAHQELVAGLAVTNTSLASSWLGDAAKLFDDPVVDVAFPTSIRNPDSRPDPCLAVVRRGQLPSELRCRSEESLADWADRISKISSNVVLSDRAASSPVVLV